MSTALKNLNQTRYRKLLSQVMPVAIETEEENERMLAVVQKLMDKGEDISAEEDTLLRLLATLIQDFEERYYKPGEVSPLEMLHHLMEARGLKPTDLWELFGSKGIASEVLNGKRSISKTQAKKLAVFFQVSADFFI